MNMQWIMQHKLVVVIIVVIVVIGVGYGLSQGGAEEPLLTPEVVPTGSPTADSTDQELVETLLALKAVTLTALIFEDPAFKSLKDLGQTIVPEPIGRENPFAPLSAPRAQGASPALPTR